MTASLDPKIPSLVARFLERRYVTLIRDVRRERQVIAHRMAADGTVLSGGFVVKVTAAFKTGFETYARGAMQDVLGLMRQSVGRIDENLSNWIKEQLEPAFERTAEHLCGEVSGGGPMTRELQPSVKEAMKMSLAAMKRDLGIELDMATLTEVSAVPVVDEALRDTLVPLQNSRGLGLEFQVCTKDSDAPLVLVLFDIDHFKQVNDKHGGHATGDEALVSVAQIAATCIKGKGSAYRIGGDEFALLLPNHTLQEGLAVAERFRREVNASPMTSQKLPLSVSVGVAVKPTNGEDLDTLKKAADGALYDAKNRGRNLVRYCGEPEPSAPGPRETERKQPEPGGLTLDEQTKIREDYFRSHLARCPRDQAVLEVNDVTAQQDDRSHILIRCPLCGLLANVP
jgi:diguanylate cyclase (GGDEF)-like protein